ncbi:gp436 family protein [Chitinibacter sp. S2-10]|uniref:gp436 family protein n=1 Tax=Chitinibacter sp. S2-10 TaxID=3373597 RepID=UPI003977B014
MTYATADDMVKRFGEREVIALTDRSFANAIDADVLAGALNEANAEIDAHLASRYSVPLSPVPSLLVGVACDIARYRLCGASVVTSDEIRNRYKDATKLLEKVGSGLLSLGGMPSGEVVQPTNTIQFVGGGKVFGRDAL